MDEQFGTERSGAGTRLLEIRPFGTDDDDEREHADGRRDARPEEGMGQGAPVGSKSHSSRLPLTLA
ncbi:hypothetical protein GCM10009689_05900 [Brevibacterium antiquum]